jgi:hypothetical protein
MAASLADRIWNRAALERGGASPREGDRALAALLLVHGLVMNGGVHHAIECVDAAELAAAAAGYAFFGLDEVSALFRGGAGDPSTWTAASEVETDRRYRAVIPDDGSLDARFQQALRERPWQFAPVAGA